MIVKIRNTIHCSNPSFPFHVYEKQTIIVNKYLPLMNTKQPSAMKHILPIVLFVSFLFWESGCKDVVEDVIDCSLESARLSINDEIDENNPKLVHFEFVNKDVDGSFTLDNEVKWDFGDGHTTTSTTLKIDHTYTQANTFAVKATYTLRRGSASCTGPKEKSVTIE